MRNYYQQLKRDVFSAYGGPKCICCGEVEIAFLSLDHILNNGNEHRRMVGKNTIYVWLKQNNFPDKSNYQVLCMNCQFGKQINSICPHQKDQL